MPNSPMDAEAAEEATYARLRNFYNIPSLDPAKRDPGQYQKLRSAVATTAARRPVRKTAPKPALSAGWIAVFDQTGRLLGAVDKADLVPMADTTPTPAPLPTPPSVKPVTSLA